MADAHSAEGLRDERSGIRAIESLLATYAELVDGGDFAAVGGLFAEATFAGGAGSVRGAEPVETMLRNNIIVYDDGSPRTKHLVTNVVVEIAGESGSALARSYFTVLQALPDFALQLIATGRYRDRFQRREGVWRFVERRVQTDFAGDMSHHLRASSQGATRS